MTKWERALPALGIGLVVWGSVNAIIVYGHWMEVLEYYGGTDVDALMFSLGRSSLINSMIMIGIGMVAVLASIVRIKKSKSLKKGE